MNESETRAELIDPALKEKGWGVVEGTKVLREYQITIGKIKIGGGKRNPLKADYSEDLKLKMIEAISKEQL